jgi:hypothetical protein
VLYKPPFNTNKILIKIGERKTGIMLFQRSDKVLSKLIESRAITAQSKNYGIVTITRKISDKAKIEHHRSSCLKELAQYKNNKKAYFTPTVQILLQGGSMKNSKPSLHPSVYFPLPRPMQAKTFERIVTISIKTV